MTPEERQLLTGLFDRVRAAQGTPRDGEAEAFIADAVRALPSAPYLLAQSVIVQEQALHAANDKIQQLEAQVQELQNAAPAPSNSGGGSFLGGIGRSLFGGGEPPRPEPAPTSVPPGGPWGNQNNQNAYAPPPPPPQMQQWSAPPQAPMGGGGSFLHGALGTAAGVAGGVLLANSIRGLFSGGSNPLGIGSGLGGGLGGIGGGVTPTGSSGETIVNNYYENADDTKTSDQPVETSQYDDDGTTVSDADFQDNSGDWGGDDDNGTDDNGTLDV